MQILVTGGAGFIGSHVVEKLIDMNHEVICIDNFDTFYDVVIKESNIGTALKHDTFHLYRNDILDTTALKKIFSKHDINLVIHLAAKAGVRPSIQDPHGYYRTNVEGTLNLLEACKDFGINKFILASSSSVYGNNEKIPFSEDDNVDYPISPYAATKKAAELLCHNYHHLYQMNIFALRFFTVYGPRQRPDLAIHKFFNLIEQNKSIPVYGDGNTYRDYTYIDDILVGVIRSVEKVSGFEIINLGESRTISLNELLDHIENITGKAVERQYSELQPGDVNRTYADITKARNLLGYDPKTDFESGLRKFYKWFLNRNRKLR